MMNYRNNKNSEEIDRMIYMYYAESGAMALRQQECYDMYDDGQASGSVVERRLPCRTYISVGCCPYRDRCAYIHDPRIATYFSKSKSRRKVVENPQLHDCFFWPALEDVTRMKFDNSGRPLVRQEYYVPASKATPSTHGSMEEFSMWNHFVNYVAAETNGHSNGLYELSNEQEQLNIYTGRQRLPIFAQLSQSEGFEKENVPKRNVATSPKSVTSSSIFYPVSLPKPLAQPAKPMDLCQPCIDFTMATIPAH